MKDTATYIKLSRKPSDNFPDKVLVHHTGGTDLNPKADTSSHTAQMIESWHLAKGWEGLGYHYVIHKDGEVWRGRPEHYHGAHEPTQNTKSIGMCLSGNFDVTYPTPQQIASLRTLLRDVCTRYSISKEEIYPHRKFRNKSCYGTKLMDNWASDLLEERDFSCIAEIEKKSPALWKRILNFYKKGV